MFGKVIMTVVVLASAFTLYSYIFKSDSERPLQEQKSGPINVKNTKPAETPQTSDVAVGLDTPWSIVFMPDNTILVAERSGQVRLIDSNRTLDPTPVAKFEQALEIGEGGLLGMTLHPDFENNRYIYFYYTYSSGGDGTLNRVVRTTYQNNRLGFESIIVDAIPGASNHNGGRIKFGPDNYLYITTGDAQNPSRSQDKNNLAGKILRVTDEGKPAPGNPFGNLIYSYGHRNPQGLAWDQQGRLYATEHGRSGILSGFDEFNLIEPGRNYGWPDIEGDAKKEDMVTALLHSGPSTTWAPASLAYLNNAFYFGGLRGTTLYKVTLSDNKPAIEEFFKGEFGRIRDVVAGPDGLLYITTSNLDGRGIPKSGDDRIIRINPNIL